MSRPVRPPCDLARQQTSLVELVREQNESTGKLTQPDNVLYVLLIGDPDNLQKRKERQQKR